MREGRKEKIKGPKDGRWGRRKERSTEGGIEGRKAGGRDRREGRIGRIPDGRHGASARGGGPHPLRRSKKGRKGGRKGGCKEGRKEERMNGNMEGRKDI
jgi:hypothetical protein